MQTVKHTRLLDRPAGVHAVRPDTDRGQFAVVVARPADTTESGVDATDPDSSGDNPGGVALLVPGWTGSKEDFLAVLAPLARAGWTVASFDQRGQFESAGYDDLDDYTWSNLAADAAAVATWLAPGERVHLVGHSFGGLVSAAAAVGHPDTWASVTLLCSGPAGLPDPAVRDGLLQVADALDGLPDDPGERAEGLAALWDVKRRMEIASGAEPAEPAVEDYLRRRFLADDPHGLAAFTRMLASGPDRIDDLARTDLPAFVVYGEDDDAWPLDLQDQVAHRLGSTPVVIAGAGHSPAVDQPETTADVLIGLWMGALDDPPGGDEPAA